VNLTDGKSHPLALYFLDWDSSGRAESIQIVDANTGQVLDTRSVSGFSGGQYLNWNVSGHVVIKIAVTGGTNAAVSGVFF